MTKSIAPKARTQNPALAPFEQLIGKWHTTASHPYLPGQTFHGRATFEWLEAGAFIMCRSELDDPHFPQGIAIFGSDDHAGTFYMLYFDERKVSRKYDIAVTKNGFTWTRDDPELSQHFTLTIEDDGRKIVSKGQMSQDGKTWEKDLELVYTR